MGGFYAPRDVVVRGAAIAVAINLGILIATTGLLWRRLRKLPVATLLTIE